MERSALRCSKGKHRAERFCSYRNLVKTELRTSFRQKPLTTASDLLLHFRGSRQQRLCSTPMLLMVFILSIVSCKESPRREQLFFLKATTLLPKGQSSLLNKIMFWFHFSTILQERHNFFLLRTAVIREPKE